MDTSYFFLYETQLPKGIGFLLFGKAHLSWICFIIVSLCIFLYFYRTYNKKKQNQVLKIIGCSLMFLEVVRSIFLWQIHFLSVYELPLHLCGLAGLFCLLEAYTKLDWISHTIYAACLPGTIGALLFPDWTMYPMFNIINIQAFVFHALVVFYASAMLMNGYRPRIKKLYEPILFLLFLAIPIYIFDLYFQANYMFLQVPSKGSPLIFIKDLTGEKWYLIGLILFVIACMCLLDGLYLWINQIIGKKTAKSRRV